VSPELPETAPLLVLLPGLTGGSGDTYVQHAVVAARSAGIRAAVFNSRGTADSPVLTPQFYSASFTGDTRAVIAHVRQRFPHAARVYAAGWSLGANILVNYLAEEGESAPLDAAVSMCNPFDLTISNRHLESGFNRIYDANLAASLRRIFARHTELWRTAPPPLRPDLVPSCRTIREFDDAITIHSFGARRGFCSVFALGLQRGNTFACS
jgi:predicted alpha/beta-fold hydrolase